MVALDESLSAAIRRAAAPLGREPWDVGRVMDAVGEAAVVLMGEATHGTHEFYEFRAELSKRLIEERGFGAIAVEADWPDAYRINRFVRGQGSDEEAVQALA